MENVKKIIEEKKRILDDIQKNGYLEITEKAAEAMTESVQAGNKIILAVSSDKNRA